MENNLCAYCNKLRHEKMLEDTIVGKVCKFCLIQDYDQWEYPPGNDYVKPFNEKWENKKINYLIVNDGGFGDLEKSARFVWGELWQKTG